MGLVEMLIGYALTEAVYSACVILEVVALTKLALFMFAGPPILVFLSIVAFRLKVRWYFIGGLIVYPIITVLWLVITGGDMPPLSQEDFHLAMLSLLLFSGIRVGVPLLRSITMGNFSLVSPIERFLELVVFRSGGTVTYSHEFENQ